MFSLLQTLALPCSAPDIIYPLNPQVSFYFSYFSHSILLNTQNNLFSTKNQDIIDEILSSPLPDLIEEILTQSSILATATGLIPITDQTQQQELLERFFFYFYFLFIYFFFHILKSYLFIFSLFKNYRVSDFIFVVQQEGNFVQLQSLGQSSLTTATNILNINPSDNILDEVYDLVAQLETAFLCQSVCGQAPTIVEVFFFFFLK